VLALPEHLLDLIPPQPTRVPSTREHFRGYTNPMLDPVAIAEMSADHSASLLFNPERAARLLNQSARNGDQPGLDELIRRTSEATLLSDAQSGYIGSIQRGINMAVLRNMISLAANQNASPDVQAVTRFMLEDLKGGLKQRADRTDNIVWKAHYQKKAGLIEEYMERPAEFTVPPSPYMPPGAPIGSGDLPSLHLMCDF
jgi:hypothetical protein